MENRIAKLDDMRIAGYKIQTSMDAVASDNPLPKFWEAIYADGRMAKLDELGSDCPGSYGVSVMRGMQDMDYIVGRALPKSGGPVRVEGLDIVSIPGGEYLEYSITLAELGDAFGHAGDWMAENGYDWSHGTSFEFYDEDSMKLYIPITKV
ncbi:MAG: GyrI-like domain-containing protein [Defluviitaleaceae bacterium]|nr:GyrI-like domain-containing protein [Defluviitaleaceae bacterium]